MEPSGRGQRSGGHSFHPSEGMAMLAKSLATGALAALALLVGGGAARADETLNLVLNRAAAEPAGLSGGVMTLGLDQDDADTIAVWGRRGFYGGGYRGWGGYGGGFRSWGGYGGYRGFYGGYSYYPRYY